MTFSYHPKAIATKHHPAYLSQHYYFDANGLRKVPDNLQRSQSEPCRHQERTEDRIRKNGMTPDFLRCRISLFLCFTDLSHEMTSRKIARHPASINTVLERRLAVQSVIWFLSLKYYCLSVVSVPSFFCSLRLVFRSLNLKRSRRSHQDRAQEKQEKHR